MASGSYFPAPVKAVPIAKKSGGERILGVPTIADRTAQAVVTGVLVPALEAVLSNLFLHYALDSWLARHFPSIPF